MSNREYYCGLDAALSVVSGRWKFLVLWELDGRGPSRYGELRRAVEGVSEKMLISALKELRDAGVIERHDHHEVPPRVEYELTDLGHGLADALKPLASWGCANMPTPREVQRLDPNRS